MWWCGKTSLIVTALMTLSSLFFGGSSGMALLYYFAAPSTQYAAYNVVHHVIQWSVLAIELFSSSSIAVMMILAPIGFLAKKFLYGWLPLVYATIVCILFILIVNFIAVPFKDHYRHHERAAIKYSKAYKVRLCDTKSFVQPLDDACDKVFDVLSQTPEYLAFKDVLSELVLHMKILTLFILESWLMWIAIFIGGAVFSYIGFRRINQRKQRKRHDDARTTTASKKEVYGNVLMRSLGSQQAQAEGGGGDIEGDEETD